MIAIQDYYEDEFSVCFGCGRLNKDGHQLKTFLIGNETISKHTPDKNKTAINGIVYGGLLASLIDCHGTGSASVFYAKQNGIELEQYNAPRFVTGNLNVSYLKPTPLNKELVLKGKLKEINGRKVLVSIAVYCEDILTVEGEVIALLLPENFKI
ncbi:MAG TPA: PaaI family thioesterase [Lutibacter sp.]|nr:PaaI family thioesterase [Lutibacter sp.]